MPARLGFGAGELHAHLVAVPPALFAADAKAVMSDVEKEGGRHGHFRGDTKFGAPLVHVANGTGDRRAIDAQKDSCALENARPVDPWRLLVSRLF